MKKVIIADDDFLVRTYLKQMIPWEQKGYVIAGDAKNGSEVLSLVASQKPELIITDICMPVMDGIELIRSLKEKKFPGRILVLSSHDDFVYVKEAMKLGIEDYLLKNELTPEKLQSFLEQETADELEKTNSEEHEELARIGREKMKEEFLMGLLQGEEQADVLKEKSKVAGMEADFALGAGILIRLRDWQHRRKSMSGEAESSFQHAFLEMCRNVIRQETECSGKVCSWVFLPKLEEEYVAVLLDFGHGGSTARWQQWQREIAQKINIFGRRYLNASTTLLLADMCRGLGEMMKHWHALYYCRWRLFYEGDGCLTCKELPAWREEPSAAILEMVEGLSHAGAEREERLQAFLECLGEEHLPPEQVRMLIERIMPLSYRERQEVFPDFQAMTKSIMSFKESLRVEAEHPAVRKAAEYMRLHSREDLTQAEVANHVRLNAAYFSTLFKRCTGKGFAEYLTEQRLARVKARLRQETSLIKEIAQEEGFFNYQHFCRLFHQSMGVTPREYRMGKEIRK